MRLRNYLENNQVDHNWCFTNGNNIWHEAVLSDNREVIDLLLTSHVLDFDYPNKEGFTPLMVCDNVC